MEKMILSTGNLMTQGFLISPHAPTYPTPTQERELRKSLEDSIREARVYAASLPQDHPRVRATDEYIRWTSESEDGKTRYVPELDFSESALDEEREQYDITVKIFFLPGEDRSARKDHVREALDLVLKELHMPSIDLLVLQFPGVYFDEDTEDCPDKIKSRGPRQSDPEPLESQVETWGIVEQLQEEGLVLRLGVSEFGAERLAPFLDKVRVQPAVDQISLRDCCSVPKPLSVLAKQKKIELLVHNDVVNILPRGTLRELLDEGCADILGSPLSKLQAGHKRKRHEGLAWSNRFEGTIEPQWVVKYTAVVKNRGVVENKGYFACAKYLERPESVK